jgi:hypothetical protein
MRFPEMPSHIWEFEKITKKIKKTSYHFLPIFGGGLVDVDPI